METKNSQTLRQKLKGYKAHPFSAIVAGMVLLAALITFCVLIFLVAFILVKGILQRFLF